MKARSSANAAKAKGAPGRIVAAIRCAAFRALDDDMDVEVAEIGGERLNLDKRLRIAVIRRRVHDPKAPPEGPAPIRRVWAACREVSPPVQFW